MKNLQEKAWLITLICTGIGAAILLLWLGAAKDAAQQTATAVIALAFTLIPFCFSKALQEFTAEKDKKQDS